MPIFIFYFLLWVVNRHADLEREHSDLKLKFIEGAKERKELYNKVLELKG